MKMRYTFAGAAIVTSLACIGQPGRARSPSAPPQSVHDAIAKMRIVQGKYPYTEVNDRAMNGIIVADRAIDEAWVEAAKDPAAFKARQERVRATWLDAIGGFPERCDLDVKTTGVIERDGTARSASPWSATDTTAPDTAPRSWAGTRRIPPLRLDRSFKVTAL